MSFIAADSTSVLTTQALHVRTDEAPRKSVVRPTKPDLCETAAIQELADYLGVPYSEMNESVRAARGLPCGPAPEPPPVPRRSVDNDPPIHIHVWFAGLARGRRVVPLAHEQYLRLLADPAFISVDKYGSGAEIIEGEVGRYFGRVIVLQALEPPRESR